MFPSPPGLDGLTRNKNDDGSISLFFSIEEGVIYQTDLHKFLFSVSYALLFLFSLLEISLIGREMADRRRSREKMAVAKAAQEIKGSWWLTTQGPDH